MTEVTVETSLACKLKNAVLIIRTVVSLLVTRLLKLSSFACVFCDLKVATLTKKNASAVVFINVGKVGFPTLINTPAGNDFVI